MTTYCRTDKNLHDEGNNINPEFTSNIPLNRYILRSYLLPVNIMKMVSKQRN